jgi:DNA-binding MurR/RpiR family transcriptional regulator
MQTTRPDERMVPPGICACQVRISEEEVSDFCSVLSPADRVFVVGSADTATVARLFRLSLDDLGFVADLLDTATVCRVQPTNTVVAIAGPQVDGALVNIVGLVCDTRAVLLAVATHQSPMLLDRADAAITLPSTAGKESIEERPAEDSLDFMSLVAIHAVHRDLTRRYAAPTPCRTAVGDFRR